jgi:hypothetical protein
MSRRRTKHLLPGCREWVLHNMPISLQTNHVKFQKVQKLKCNTGSMQRLYIAACFQWSIFSCSDPMKQLVPKCYIAVVTQWRNVRKIMHSMSNQILSGQCFFLHKGLLLSFSEIHTFFLIQGYTVTSIFSKKRWRIQNFKSSVNK